MFHVSSKYLLSWQILQRLNITCPPPSPPCLYPPPPPLKRGHNARSRGPPNHFPSWNSFSFVLKVNKIGQQGKYFYSRKRSQIHRCFAEAEWRGNMVLAVIQLSRSFKFKCFSLSPGACGMEVSVWRKSVCSGI